MYDDRVKIHHYFIPALFLVSGAATIALERLFWVGVVLLVLGSVVTAHLGLVEIMRETGKLLREIQFFYDSVNRLGPEERYILGLTTVQNQLKVVVDQTNAVGNEFSQVWRNLPVPPWKMKVIAQACLNGTPFTVRQWTGDGKLLSDDQYEELQNSLLDLKFLVPRSEKDNRQGFRWTDAGMDMLKQCVASPLR